MGKMGSRMRRLLAVTCLLCANAVVCEASIFSLHESIPKALYYIRKLWVSEAETQMAIKDRHYEPAMEKNVFAHPTAVVPTAAPRPTVTAAPVLTTAPSFGGGNITAAPIPSISPYGTTGPTIGGSFVTLPPANGSIPPTLAPTAGNVSDIPLFLEQTVSPGGELRSAGTAQFDALNSVLTNFGTLNTALPADQLVLINAYALNTLYYSTMGLSWRFSTNWNSNIPPCNLAQPWFGVTCDATGAVANISLSDNDAVGPLPSEIRAFRALCTS
jgi:hypothetical protein